MELNDLSIYELRNYGRLVGVKNPTNKTKAVLIEEIELIRAGTLEPSMSSKKGRPPKVKLQINEDDELITKKLLSNFLTDLKLIKERLSELDKLCCEFHAKYSEFLNHPETIDLFM